MISIILLVFAFVCFILSAVGVSSPRVNLIALGLGFWVLTLILGGSVLRP